MAKENINEKINRLESQMQKLAAQRKALISQQKGAQKKENTARWIRIGKKMEEIFGKELDGESFDIFCDRVNVMLMADLLDGYDYVP